MEDNFECHGQQRTEHKAITEGHRVQTIARNPSVSHYVLGQFEFNLLKYVIPSAARNLLFIAADEQQIPRRYASRNDKRF
jgi:hypothetical protein